MPTKSQPQTDTQPDAKKTVIKEASRFGLVGIINTLIDFAIATFIAGLLGGTTVFFNFFGFTITGVIIGSVLGGCIAMINSYILNMRFTFKARGGGLRQAVLFFAITGFGLIILRPIVIHIFTDWWTFPVDLGYFLTQAIGLKFTYETVFELVGAAAGIVFIWPYNFILYKKVVFKKGQS
jgi:putative flippase GtrA